jgi:hypothetical protein
LHIVNHVAYFLLFCQGHPSWWLKNLSGVSRIYAVIHLVSPSVVFAVHSKDVVFGEELFQFLIFSLKFGIAASVIFLISSWILEPGADPSRVWLPA